ncbi:MAG TPA: TRAP transporter large permease subunit [Desulfobacterales bacterium]|nr:TRAP transporter large permease subunit [Desulfobacterales bacterium]
MSIELISIVIVVAMVVLMAMGLPLAWSIGAVAVGLVLMKFDPSVMMMLVSRVFDMSMNYTLMSVPLFVLMAGLLQRAGIADQLFRAVNVWAGGLRGGIAVGTIIANAIMASMVGIIGAEIVTFGLIALPEMLSKKYDHKLALGSVAAGGGLATLIPPSVVFIVYGMTAGVSVGELFLAGILPGLMLGGMFIFYVIWRVWRNPESAPLVAEELRAMPVRQKLATLKELTLPLLITAGVLGSIYAGVATPSEAAGVGVILALVSAAINRKLHWPMVRDSLYETLRISCMLSWLFFGAQTIIGAYTLAGGTTFVTNAIKALDLGPWGTVILMNLIWAFLGCFLDWIGILFLTVPIFLPIILDFGFDPVWFGVVYCMNMHLSYLTPPFAPSAFYLKSITPPDVTMSQIYKATMPYLWWTVVANIVTVGWPQLSLWLPQLLLRR